MAISTLAAKHGFQSFPHYTGGRSGAKINKIVIHHAATTNFDVMPGCWQTRQASAHYGIGKAGEIRAYVDEDNTAWHAGNWDANISSIGIEHTNSTGDPTWNVNQATIDASAKLCADIAKRRGLGQLAPYKNLYPHSQFSATACPGVLKDKLQEIANKANAINAGHPSINTGLPFEGRSLEQLASDVQAGRFGVGDDRRKRLGDYFTGVQAIVNERARVNTAAQTHQILANETRAGRFGVNPDRQRLLGTYYNVVQSIIGGAPSAQQFHTVQRGETLSGIASRYGTTWQNLQRLNNLANPNIIQIGQRLRIK